MSLNALELFIPKGVILWLMNDTRFLWTTKEDNFSSIDFRAAC
jgi:hypothetical protein